MTGTARTAHLCLVQPEGYVHSLALADPLQYVKRQLERLGVQVTAGKNRLVKHSINFVFGAHLGFEQRWLDEFNCVLVNLEQLGTDGSAMPSSYLDLLRRATVVDYHEDNLTAYRDQRATRGVPLIPFGFAPYLYEGFVDVPLDQRPIDLLFIGSLTPRRVRVLQELQQHGISVASPNAVLYGPERDRLVRSSKAVLNIGAYDSPRFEQVRASIVMSCGTPLLSERRGPLGESAAGYEDVVDWLDIDDIAHYFLNEFGSPTQLSRAEEQLDRFRSHECIDAYADMWSVVATQKSGPLQEGFPNAVHVIERSGQYRPGALNVSSNENLHPDVLVGPSEAPTTPWVVDTQRWGKVVINEGALSHITLGFVELGGLPTAWFSAALSMLRDGGRLSFDWPLGRDVAPVEAVCERHWESGHCFERFEVLSSIPCDVNGQPCDDTRADRLRITLTKRPCTDQETTRARSAAEGLLLT
ncbi:hypothetical protein [Kineococcus sp. G2]|uniref:hypothetical protein n=1 Tax=Kineococcus sp. G2 TaxID=3127484 RepID=UPI00301B8829